MQQDPQSSSSFSPRLLLPLPNLLVYFSLIRPSIYIYSQEYIIIDSTRLSSLDLFVIQPEPIPFHYFICSFVSLLSQKLKDSQSDPKQGQSTLHSRLILIPISHWAKLNLIPHLVLSHQSHSHKRAVVLPLLLSFFFTKSNKLDSRQWLSAVLRI